MKFLSDYLARMRGQGKSPGLHTFSWMIWSWLGGFIGIWACYRTNAVFNLSVNDNILLIGSFGASAVLIYGAPQVPYAQPRNLVGGHIISALVGVAISQYLNWPIEILAALAVSTSILFMHLTKTIHPPGGATALIAIIGGDSIQQLGFMYVIQPVLSGVLVMLVVAVLLNNLSKDSQRHYPKIWF